MTKKTTNGKTAAVVQQPMIIRARDLGTTTDQLESMLLTPNPAVAINIAQRPDLNDRLAERLATDSRAAVRLRVAKNIATPAHLLERLQNDASPEVSAAANETLVLQSINKSDEGFGNG